MKKRALVTICLVAMTTMLAACGKEKVEQPTDITPTPTEKVIEQDDEPQWILSFLRT